MHERFVGVRGRPTLFNANESHTRECARLEDARLFSTGPDMFTTDEYSRFNAVSQHTAMKAAGCDVRWSTWPIPHAVSPEEIADIGRWLGEVLK